MGYAAVLGEALVDLLGGDVEGEPVYRPAAGGAPFNVAVGVARLGGQVEYAGAISSDHFGAELYRFLLDNGVGVRGVRRVDAPTTLAVATFRDAEPQFSFYGDSHARFGPADLDADLVAGASVVCAGSIALLWPEPLA